MLRAFQRIVRSPLSMIDNPLVWIDCEASITYQCGTAVGKLWADRLAQMTGLDITKDHLIEIAVLITNGDLEIVAKVIHIAKATCKVARIRYDIDKI